ncbi:MAG: right-handed parallel beta-helix repeat-containing protein, partial [Bacteroidales bacterium]|nr:right-handed parallel beta-helix repeat-containing protein [Bacteroidales bacterium]
MKLKRKTFDLNFINKSIIVLFVLGLFNSFNPIYADTYYVAPYGDDNNPGTIAEPWATFTKANTVLQAGDTVFIREGTYNDRIEPVNSGTPGNYITYMAYPGETPVIDRSVLITNWNEYTDYIYWAEYTGYTIPLWEDTFEEAGFYCGLWPVFSLSDLDEPGKFFHDEVNERFYVWTSTGDDPNNHTMRASTGKGAHFDKDYIVIDGINMKWIVIGILSDNCSNCIFKNIDIQYTYGGMALKWDTHHNQILNNTIFHAGSWYWDEGDGIFLTGHHTLIEGNDISLTAHNPINTRGYDTGIAAHHNIIQNNRLHDCGSSAICSNYNTYREVWRNNFAYRCTGCGLQTDGYDNAFYNNVCYHNGQAGGVYLTDGRTGGNNKFFNNTFYNNNSIYLSQPQQVLYPEEWSITECIECVVDSNIFKNNIIYNTEDDSTKLYMIYSDLEEFRSNVFCYNDFFNDREVYIRDIPIGTNPLFWWEEYYHLNFNNNIITDPLFLDPNNEDFNLESNSQLINAGTFLTNTVSSNTGSVITVEDAGYFCDGYGITEGDLIQLEGQNETARIIEVDYDNNIIYIDSIFGWVAGQGIGFPYSSSAPDMGAF